MITSRLGAEWLGNRGTRFVVWTPRARTVAVEIPGDPPRSMTLRRRADGTFQGTLKGVKPGARYHYLLDGVKRRPDPASQSQPDGVHHDSEVVDPRFPWTDHEFRTSPLRDWVIYELHVGTFTRQGTFDAIIPELPRLKTLGITTLELMPVAQFPGGRNWGYDGVLPFAVQNTYGGVLGFKRLVNAAHDAGLAVILDVVYNHLGPEGNYLADFGPYFTDRYRTPWGAALNFDGPDSDPVRDYFIQNALHWQSEYHLDGLRLDAVHAICDTSATPFLAELSAAAREQAQALGRPFHLIAESDLNDVRMLLPQAPAGMGMDAQWSDDFHHSLHVLLTGERDGYYSDFDGLHSLAATFRQGYAYSGQYSPHRRRRHGNAPEAASLKQFVVCAQNHDQVGNRMQGDRLSAALDPESLKLAAGTVLLSPFLPLVFMGEEYGETAPFQYFTSHTDPALAEAVRRGRAAEFSGFRWQGRVPNPQAKTTFNRSQLRPTLRTESPHRELESFYRDVIRARRAPAIRSAKRQSTEVTVSESAKVLQVTYRHARRALVLLLSFGTRSTNLRLPWPRGTWNCLVDSSAPQYGGTRSGWSSQITSRGTARIRSVPRSVALYELSSARP